VDYEVFRKLAKTVEWPYPENGVHDYLKHVVLPPQGETQWTWGIFLKDNLSELIGIVDLWKNGEPENRGFWLGRKYWGQGIMTEAVYPVMDFAFNEIGFKELFFSNAVGNLRSRRIKEKTGCQFHSTRPYQYIDPELTESEIWRLTKENWEIHRASSQMEYELIR